MKAALSVAVWIGCCFVCIGAALIHGTVLSTKKHSAPTAKSVKFANSGQNISGLGWLVSPPVNTTVWSCLIERDSAACPYGEQCERGLIRLFRNNAQTDSESTLKAARDEEIQDVLAPEGHVTPCFNCGDPEKQGTAACNLSYASVYYMKRLWINIQDPYSWSDNITANVDFIKAFTVAAQEKCQIAWPFVGVFTSQDDWVAITGNSTEFSSDYALGYTHIDGKPSFDDFKPFGGWTKKTVLEKRYLATFRACGVIADRIKYQCNAESDFPCDIM